MVSIFRCTPNLYHANVGVQIIAMLELGTSTLFLSQVSILERDFIYLFYIFFAVVARMLWEMAESKVHAQEEVVYWKKKYEMERLQNANFEHLVAPDHTSGGPLHCQVEHHM